MNVTVEAVYKDGVFKPKQPLALAEGTEVRIAIMPAGERIDPLEAVIGIGESGRTDGADNHDHYIYGTRKIR